MRRGRTADHVGSARPLVLSVRPHQHAIANVLAKGLVGAVKLTGVMPEFNYRPAVVRKEAAQVPLVVVTKAQDARARLDPVEYTFAEDVVRRSEGAIDLELALAQ